MEPPVFYALSFFLIIASLLAHELGHAVTMRRRGVEIEEIGLGLPIPFLTLRFTLSRWPGILFAVSPLLLGAYVKPTEGGEETMRGLSYRDQAIIYGAGPLVNILIFFLFQIILLVATGRAGLPLVVFAGLLLLFYWGRNIFSVYGVPILGLALLILTAWLIATDPASSMAGPVGIVQLGKKTVGGLLSAVSFAGIISLSLGLMNVMPLYPLDGGRTMGVLVDRALGPSWAGRFERVSGYLFFLLIIFAIGGDFVKLLF